ncbi:putative Islet cell autoantigen 1-like protein [Hypsibius exemplaris]|uniref:Islet cell autoantigen 1-like protein n=1 Tax=Hypsibius exemplaris TaxID=2072580 RepID=A0A1W0WDV3_HYPEX|nr:putative Islet cell autoantigen 1-like protein [Hypsibius exemplaris]
MEARAPLIRLAQDTLTYRRCAVTDTERKISQMEEARTEYRGTLLWMKNVSEELDPDTFKQLEKFRKVQGQVRVKKERFDSQKLDTLQKIDLLAISRLNMLSQSLSPYGSTLHEFYQKVATVFGSVTVPKNQNLDEAEQRILQANFNAADKRTEARKPVEDASQDVSLLDFSSDATANGDSSSELLDALWRESGLETNNFDPLVGGLDGLSMDSSDVPEKKDSPDPFSSSGNLFDFSELDDTENGGLEFFGEALQPGKFSPVNKHSLLKDGTTGGSGGARSFLPSQLLKKGWQASTAAASPTTPTKPDLPPATKESKLKDASAKPVTPNPHQAWYNLFADLDPLSNGSQDLVKKSDGDKDPSGSSC